MQYKLRSIVKSDSSKTAKLVMGLTVPNDVAVFFEGCHFTIERSGACIIAYSGASLIPTKQEINKFNLNEVRT